jgi:2-polyprenyl-3-methyl-5-hydroxy-6-metoxy-1,4-benzoquinol methylase
LALALSVVAAGVLFAGAASSASAAGLGTTDRFLQFLRRRAPADSGLRVSLVRLRSLTERMLVRLGVHQSDETLEAAAQQFWIGVETPRKRSDLHMRDSPLGELVFERLGAETTEIFKLFARAIEFPTQDLDVIEWGCGGGANLVAFAPFTKRLVGVDANAEALQEAERQLVAIGRTDFAGIRVDIRSPEAAIDQWSERFDVFLCLYVFEALPTPEYGRRLLRIAAAALRPGGMALIQIKYATGHASAASKRYSYRLNYASMTTYPIHEFWQLAEEEGFRPRLIHLQPLQPLVRDQRYAYFLLTRGEQDPPGS